MTPRKIFAILTVRNAYYLWVILLFSVVTMIFNKNLGFFELTVFAVLLAHYIIGYMREQNKFLKYVENLSLSVDTVSREAIFNFIIPVVVLNGNGVISWYNDEFLNLIDNVENNDRNFAYDRNISEFIDNIALDYQDSDGLTRLSFDITHKERNYHVFGNTARVDSEDQLITILYFDDKTEFENLKTKYKKEKFVSAVIVCDNYDDVIQDTPVGERPMLIATLDNMLSDLSAQVNGVLKKQEKDRYFFYFQKEYLDKFIDNKFEILNKVKEISIGNKIPITLSIGIGCDGETMSVNDSYSYNALDMALGRGGDQAVIKDGEKFSFFGGSTKELEKRTRVKARVVSYALKELINESENVLIMGHKNADIDSCGAAMGIYKIASSMGKETKIVMQTNNKTVMQYKETLNDEYNDVFVSPAYAGEIITRKTLLIIVDTHKTSLVEVPSLLDVTSRIVVIDHHRRSADFIDNAVLTYHEPYASSASELVTEILQYIDTPSVLTKQEAEGLYAGIYMDTKNFTLKTGVRTFEAASYLKKFGIDTVNLRKLFQVELTSISKKWKIVENSYIYKDNVAISTYKDDDNDIQTIIAQAADELLNVKDVICSFVVCQTSDTDVMISARSFGSVNVQVILEKLGGGGHLTIAGAQLKDTTLYDAVELLKTAIDEQINA